MLSFIAQIYNYCPFPVYAAEMYVDDLDAFGLEWWYKEALDINKENEKRINERKKR